MKLGLLGKNIGYSLSPLIHTWSAERLGLRVVYDLVDIDSAQVEDLLLSKNNEYQGFNITQPYKEQVAKILGSNLPSVNTLVRKKLNWQSLSTDAPGLELGLRNEGFAIDDFSQWAILGSGGVVKALIDFLNQNKSIEPTNVYILRRNSVNDLFFKNYNSDQLKIIIMDLTQENLNKCMAYSSTQTIMLQATSAGQNQWDHSWLECLQHYKGLFVDLQYKNLSAFYEFCIQNNIRALDGLPMLYGQAILSQQIWWGKSVSYHDLKFQFTHKDLS